WLTNLVTITSLKIGSGIITLFFGFAFLIFLKFPFLFWLLRRFNDYAKPFTQPSSATSKTQTVLNLIN
ncbi:MAG: hypothetical protein II221_06265, partial [Paludibacteraceae bacterium]|nr:hypothetical protein [Paludibacteraceae bacterium]